MHSKASPASYCRVLSPGKFNSIILIPLRIHSESMTAVAIVLHWCIKHHNKTVTSMVVHDYWYLE